MGDSGQVVRAAEVTAAFAAVWGRTPTRAELAAARWVPDGGRLTAEALVVAMGTPAAR